MPKNQELHNIRLEMLKNLKYMPTYNQQRRDMTPQKIGPKDFHWQEFCHYANEVGINLENVEDYMMSWETWVWAITAERNKAKEKNA